MRGAHPRCSLGTIVRLSLTFPLRNQQSPRPKEIWPTCGRRPHRFDLRTGEWLDTPFDPLVIHLNPGDS